MTRLDTKQRTGAETARMQGKEDSGLKLLLARISTAPDSGAVFTLTYCIALYMLTSQFVDA